jgi:hypothetical protein
MLNTRQGLEACHIPLSIQNTRKIRQSKPNKERSAKCAGGEERDYITIQRLTAIPTHVILK